MIVEAIVEIPKGSYYKYEIDKKTGELVLDRVVNYPVPFNYGYVVDTLSEDGDPLDVFILSSDPIPPKTRVKVKLHSVFLCKDNGDLDHKLIGTIEGDIHAVTTLDEVSIKYYLENYKRGFTVNSHEQLNKAVGTTWAAQKAYLLAYSSKVRRKSTKSLEQSLIDAKKKQGW